MNSRLKKTLNTVQALCIAGLCFGCVDPLYKTDPTIYHQYKYWETGQQNWRKFDEFDVLYYHDEADGIHKFNLNTIKDGTPTRDFGYLEAIRTTAFDLMEETCGSKSVKVLNSPPYKALDRFFYQDYQMTVSVRFKCEFETDPKGAEYLQTEQLKWNLAERVWDDIDNTKAVIDILPAKNDGLNQIKVRVFSTNENLNRKLGRKWMKKICEGPFENVYIRPAVETLPVGKKPDVISKDNIYQYGFNCLGERQ